MVEDKFASVGVSMPIDLISSLDKGAKLRGMDFSAYVVLVIRDGMRLQTHEAKERSR